ncbi:hypothetical protein BC834DRAFT_974257 [Gloeopeniophorella convolvens]|nr:hypothetical protein BC834DRAFT_974257 [Gloeopeniophorella convolvens]
MVHFHSFIIALLAATAAHAMPAPHPRQAGSSTLADGQAAQALNLQFSTLTPSSPCNNGDSNVCVDGKFAQCVNNALVLSACAPGLQCLALPNGGAHGAIVTCDTTQEAIARIGATGAKGGLFG